MILTLEEQLSEAAAGEDAESMDEAARHSDLGESAEVAVELSEAAAGEDAENTDEAARHSDLGVSAEVAVELSEAPNGHSWFRHSPKAASSDLPPEKVVMVSRSVAKALGIVQGIPLMDRVAKLQCCFFACIRCLFRCIFGLYKDERMQAFKGALQERACVVQVAELLLCAALGDRRLVVCTFHSTYSGVSLLSLRTALHR